MDRALRFIRERAHERLTVNDVVRASGLSRRALEKHIRIANGRTILEEIRLARTDHIARLLVESNMTVTQIGKLLGFTDIKHMARYFRAMKQINPTEYRKAFDRSGQAFAVSGKKLTSSAWGRKSVRASFMDANL